jgi:hypothetical protein
MLQRVHGLGAAEVAGHCHGMHGRLICEGSQQRPHADQLPQAQVRRHLRRRRLHVRRRLAGRDGLVVCRCVYARKLLVAPTDLMHGRLFVGGKHRT